MSYLSWAPGHNIWKHCPRGAKSCTSTYCKFICISTKMYRRGCGGMVLSTRKNKAYGDRLDMEENSFDSFKKPNPFALSELIHPWWVRRWFVCWSLIQSYDHLPGTGVCNSNCRNSVIKSGGRRGRFVSTTQFSSILIGPELAISIVNRDWENKFSDVRESFIPIDVVTKNRLSLAGVWTRVKNPFSKESENEYPYTIHI